MGRCPGLRIKHLCDEQQGSVHQGQSCHGLRALNTQPAKCQSRVCASAVRGPAGSWRTLRRVWPDLVLADSTARLQGRALFNVKVLLCHAHAD